MLRAPKSALATASAVIENCWPGDSIAVPTTKPEYVAVPTVGTSEPSVRLPNEIAATWLMMPVVKSARSHTPRLEKRRPETPVDGTIQASVRALPPSACLSVWTCTPLNTEVETTSACVNVSSTPSAGMLMRTEGAFENATAGAYGPAPLSILATEPTVIAVGTDSVVRSRLEPSAPGAPSDWGVGRVPPPPPLPPPPHAASAHAASAAATSWIFTDRSFGWRTVGA